MCVTMTSAMPSKAVLISLLFLCAQHFSSLSCFSFPLGFVAEQFSRVLQNLTGCRKM